MSNSEQRCFVDGPYMLCNGIYKNGVFTVNPSGKWYKFLMKKLKSQVAKDSSEKDKTDERTPVLSD